MKSRHLQLALHRGGDAPDGPHRPDGGDVRCDVFEARSGHGCAFPFSENGF
jgi:hypothetical protein